MFGWLAKLLVESPIQGSGCACCEGKKKQLENMQKAIEQGELPEQNQDSLSQNLNFSSGSFSAQYDADGHCRCQEYTSKILGELNNNYPQIVTEESSSESGCGCGSCGCHK